MTIHSSAIVHPKAKIGKNVEIGPFCIIEEDVIIGDNNFLEGNVKIYSGTTIGNDNKFFFGGTIGGQPQDLGFKPGAGISILTIGNNNTFRENFVLHRGTKESGTVIGNHNYFMATTHVAHDVKFGNHNIMTQSAIIAGHSVVGNHAFISGLVGIHQFVRIGDYAMIGGVAKIVKDIPPYSTADGNPATIIGLNSVGMKRAGFDPEIRKQIKDTYKTIYHSGFNNSQAIQKLLEVKDRSNEMNNIIQFFQESERGVTDHR